VWENQRQPFHWRLASQIDMLLEPGEQIVWQGRPVVPSRILIRVALVATLGTLPMLVLGPDYLQAVAGCVAFSVIGLCYGAAIGHYAARHTALVLTDRRILTCSHALGRCSARTYLPEELAWKPAKAAGQPARLPLLHHVAARDEVQSLACRTLLPQLARRLHDPDPAVRRRAARSFTRFGAAACPFTGDLLAALKSEDAIVRRRATEALGSSGVVAVTADLRRLQFDDDPRVVNIASKALHVLSRSSAGSPAQQLQ
jgi:hypothetical protein